MNSIECLTLNWRLKPLLFSGARERETRKSSIFLAFQKKRETPSILITGQDTVHPSCSCRKKTERDRTRSICIMCSMQKRADRILPDRRQSAASDTAVMRRDGSSELWSPSSARLLHTRELHAVLHGPFFFCSAVDLARSAVKHPGH